MSKELDWLEAQPTRRCLGQLNEDLDGVLSRIAADADRSEARAERLDDEDRADQLRAIAARNRAVVEAAEATGQERTGAAIGAMVAAGHGRLAAALKRIAHAGCGQDLNPTIFAEVPEDGESHDFDCPKCGMAHHATRIPAEVA